MTQRLVFDIECDGLLATVSVVHCIVTLNVDTRNISTYFEGQVIDGLVADGNIEAGIEALQAAEEIIPHGGFGYDIPVIKKLYGVDLAATPQRVTDTLILSRALNPERAYPKGMPKSKVNESTGLSKAIPRHSLDAWGYRLGTAKVQHEDWSHFDEAMLKRCIGDVQLTSLVLEALFIESGQRPPYIREQIPEWLRVELRVAAIMAEQVRVGWLVDKAKLLGGIAYLQGELARGAPKIESYMTCTLVADQAWESCGLVRKHVATITKKDGAYTQLVKKVFGSDVQQVWGPFTRIKAKHMKLSSIADMKAILLANGWVPDEFNRSKKTGATTSPKLTESSLDSLKTDIGRDISSYQLCRIRLGVIQGWLEKLDDNDRLHGTVNPNGTPTGRMTHGVLCNVPSPNKGKFFAREMRDMFTATQGYSLVSADIASCQVRLLCEYMREDAVFIKAVFEGDSKDKTGIHDLNMQKTGLPNTTLAKSFFYGFLFGQGAEATGRLVGGGAVAGAKLLKRFKRETPHLKMLLDNLQLALKNRNHLYGVDRRYIHVRNKKDALVYLLQGGESSLIKMAIVLADTWIRQQNLDAQQVCVYHDEFTFEVLDAHAEAVATILERAIRVAGIRIGLKLPSKGDAVIGKTWLEVH